MHAWLSQIYGTNGAGGEDIEKTAQSMLLEKLAEAEGIDLSGLSPEQISQLAADVTGQETQQVQQPQQTQQVAAPAAQQQGVVGQQPGMVAQAGGEAPSEETVDENITKEAQAKFEEADFLGRIMAHAYTQELEKIASGKTKTAGAGEVASRALGAVKSQGGAALGAAKNMGGQAVQHIKSNPAAYAAGAGGAAAGFGAGRMSKEAAIMIEKLAEIRAGEILSENGINPATGQALPEQQVQQQAQQPQARRSPVAGPPGVQQQVQQPAASAVAQPQEQVQQAVDERAVEILKEAGWQFR